MRLRYDNLLSTSKKCRFFSNNAINRLKAYEFLAHLEVNFAEISQEEHYELNVRLNDLIVRGMKCCIYIFDATADVLSDYESSAFKLISNNGKNYSSPIVFERFPITIDRWTYGDKMSDDDVKLLLNETVNELERQIRSLDDKLLIVSWKYMARINSQVETEDEHIDIMDIISDELDSRGLDGLYSIIYRGSGEDKATNAFADHAAVTFLGKWESSSSIRRINANYNIKSTEMSVRLSGMIQTVARIRLRKHDGSQIKIFYSDDIDSRLMSDLFDYFIKNSDKDVKISGVPIYVKDNRSLSFIDDTRKLLSFDPNLFNAIKIQQKYTVNITLNNITTILPKGNKSSTSYRCFKKKLLTEYQITLNIT